MVTFFNDHRFVKKKKIQSFLRRFDYLLQNDRAHYPNKKNFTNCCVSVTLDLGNKNKNKESSTVKSPRWLDYLSTFVSTAIEKSNLLCTLFIFFLIYATKWSCLVTYQIYSKKYFEMLTSARLSSSTVCSFSNWRKLFPFFDVWLAPGKQKWEKTVFFTFHFTRSCPFGKKIWHKAKQLT